LLPFWIIRLNWTTKTGACFYRTMENTPDFVPKLSHCATGHIADGYKRDLHLILWSRPSLE